MDRNLRRVLNTKQNNIDLKRDVSISNMIDGQISISRRIGEALSLVVKSGGRLWKTYLSHDGNQYVDKDLEVSGNLNVRGSVYGNQVMMFYHPFDATGSGKVYIPWSSVSDDSSINYYNNFIAPYDGKLLKVIGRSQEALGNTVIGFHKASDGTESPSTTATETITVNMAADDTSYTFDFTSTSSFNRGDVIAVSIDPTNTPNHSRVTSVWLFNIN
jgi:hypothetical protein|tara:strand:- start:1349 stop:1996 length:648 start_codon:yes stop_codon:yes gene_type:complete